MVVAKKLNSRMRLASRALPIAGIEVVIIRVSTYVSGLARPNRSEANTILDLLCHSRLSRFNWQRIDDNQVKDDSNTFYGDRKIRVFLHCCLVFSVDKIRFVVIVEQFVWLLK